MAVKQHKASYNVNAAITKRNHNRISDEQKSKKLVNIENTSFDKGYRRSFFFVAKMELKLKLQIKLVNTDRCCDPETPKSVKLTYNSIL